ncbi:response regulator [Bordetella genomosp. 11]|uniref:Response regulator n=1 Tax=Bordetella genomosp. 11 TaxID=1416808 RepID=A0A261UEM5_9BORD|nr:response regulator [Bordetella genomosp. 11]OZI60035.1 response regulator [Bordetella genomosp. 11]
MALILVADDEILLAEMLADLLEDAGYDVLTAPHGRAALEIMKNRRPDLVITDFMMPLMTGLELAEAIRADGDMHALPVILVTGAQGLLARQRPGLFNLVVDKPYDPRMLLAEVERLVQNP